MNAVNEINTGVASLVQVSQPPDWDGKDGIFTLPGLCSALQEPNYTINGATGLNKSEK